MQWWPVAIPAYGLGELLKRPKSLVDFVAKVHFEPFVQFSFASQAKVLEYFFTLEEEEEKKTSSHKQLSFIRFDPFSVRL